MNNPTPPSFAKVSTYPSTQYMDAVSEWGELDDGVISPSNTTCTVPSGAISMSLPQHAVQDTSDTVTTLPLETHASTTSIAALHVEADSGHMDAGTVHETSNTTTAQAVEDEDDSTTTAETPKANAEKKRECWIEKLLQESVCEIGDQDDSTTIQLLLPFDGKKVL
uniref:Light-independent protochlorophyllide reductase subunit B n=1 Tax=Lygus hesperus TaxID=30085 RepID=A0A0A9WSS3_LYGHE